MEGGRGEGVNADQSEAGVQVAIGSGDIFCLENETVHPVHCLQYTVAGRMALLGGVWGTEGKGVEERGGAEHDKEWRAEA